MQNFHGRTVSVRRREVHTAVIVRPVHAHRHANRATGLLYAMGIKDLLMTADRRDHAQEDSKIVTHTGLMDCRRPFDSDAPARTRNKRNAVC